MSKIGGMRKLLASSIGVTCAAALVLPLTLTTTTTATEISRPAAAPGAQPARAADPGIPGSTQSLPLAPLADDRTLGSAQGLTPRDVRPFSLLGVVWDDPDTELHGSVQVRTRAAATGAWSGWQDVETHNADHAPDRGSEERTSGRVRGATAPLWVGESDGVEVRVRSADESAGTAPAPLPSGLRLELVDPGSESTVEAPVGGAPADPPVTEPLSPDTADASAPNSDLAPLGATEIPALDQAQTQHELLTLHADGLTEEQRANPYIGPRPPIVTRRGWGADESLREKAFLYTKRVKAAFVHHTATGNNYTCAQAPSVIRGIYRYHVVSNGWRDIGYNFLVDKCGNIYEGRAGGVANPVMGAHTLGFNSDSAGIAVIGSFNTTRPSATTVTAVSQLASWKLGLHGGNPSGKTYLKSAGGNLYAKGKNVRLNVISGHRDGFLTDCPGGLLYGKLGSIRSQAARFQGRS
ncbi:peptidoglycan recognition protein family protein [Streptomyces sp. HC307]|uniref:peptidoglycan recognition protein family protein n=1 Tax=Streptomyces flavusporus TaxID=3385496 RepID=UPI0039171973